MTHDTDEATQPDAQEQVHTAVLRWADDERHPFLTTDSHGEPIVVLPLSQPFTLDDGRTVGAVALDMAGLENIGAAMAGAVSPALGEVMAQEDGATPTGDTDDHLTDADRAYLATIRPDAEAMRGLPGDAWCLVADTIAQLRARATRQAATHDDTDPEG